VILCLLAGAGCDPFSTSQKNATTPKSPQPQAKKTRVAQNVYLEVLADGKRRVLIEAKVCLREGTLEHLLCKSMTKEHESILVADIDASKVHATLMAAGAEPGSVVKYEPNYKPAHGTKIKVSVQYKDKQGNLVTEPAQKWIRHGITKKEMEYDWVFAGSQLRNDPFNANASPFYAANNGDVICVSNFDTSLLDLPVPEAESTKLIYEAFTERIPPKDTPVTVILEPVGK
jgi:hypothetical protein